MKRLLAVALLIVLGFGGYLAAQEKADPMIGVNVVLNTEITDSLLLQLGSYGRVRDVVVELNAVTMQARESQLGIIRYLPWVEAANPDQEREGKPIDTVEITSFANGLNTWDLDAINVTELGTGRTVAVSRLCLGVRGQGSPPDGIP